MAFKNFIMAGSYTKIIDLNYNKENNGIGIQLGVYSDETCTNMLIAPGLYLQGKFDTSKAIVVTQILTDESVLLDMIPEFETIKDGDRVLINVESPQSNYISDINHKVVLKVSETDIKLELPVNINFNGQYYINDGNGNYTLFTSEEIKFQEDFDLIFNDDADNNMAQAYNYLSILPIFATSEKC
jgi:hypothetical protein